MKTMETIIKILSENLGLSKNTILKNKATIKIVATYEADGEWTSTEEIEDYEEFLEKYENEEFISINIDNNIPNDYIITFADFDAVYSIKFQIFYK